MTQKELKKNLEYNKYTGIFIWKSKRTGKEAGCNTKTYIYICINGKLFMAHRLAWLYVYGEFPKQDIDHINRDRYDNRIKNLRDVNAKINGQNRSIGINNTSGTIGVIWDKRRMKYQANIRYNKINKFLGYFSKLEDAINARKEGELKYFI